MGTATWPPVGSPLAGQTLQPHAAFTQSVLSLQRRTRFALALLGSLRAVLASLRRRLVLLAGWLAADAGRRRRLVLLARRRPFRLRRWHVLVGSLLACKLLHAGCVKLGQLVRSWGRREEEQRLQNQMRQATTYDAWFEAAVALDRLTLNKCSTVSAAEEASRRQLAQRTAALAQLRQSGDLLGLTFTLRMDYLRQAGSASTRALVRAAGHCPVVPEAVQQYIDEVKRSLQHVVTCPDMPLDDRLAFLRELRHAYGRTGLVLSGGGSFGFWHFGVVRALLEASLLPRVVSGSSAGSIGAALLCTRTDEEVRLLVGDFPNTAGLDFFAHSSTPMLMRHLLASGYIQDHEFFAGRLRKLLGDLTFLDAYQRSGRILNISVTAADTREPPRLLNYLTAPNVLIWSAVAASSAFPLLFAPQDLMARDARGNIVRFSETGAPQSQRRWRDGSLEVDLPMVGLSQMFNVNLFIASQANPWIIGAVYLKRLLPLTLGRLLESEFKHRCLQLLAIWPNNHLLKMMSQPWEGDITVALPPTAFPLGKAAVNFTTGDIWEAMRHGQLAVWAKLPAIQAACAIEVCIDQLLQQLTRQARQQAKAEQAVAQRRALGGMRASLPSWLHVPSLALPTVDSESSLGAGLSPSHSMASSPPPGEAYSRPPSATAEARPGTPRSTRGRAASMPSIGTGGMEGARLAASPALSVLGQPAVPAAEGATAAEAAMEAGVRATAGQLVVAGLEVAAEAIDELDPSTPTPHSRPDGAAAATEAPPIFESPSEAWRDLLLLGGISAGAGQGISMDAFAY